MWLETTHLIPSTGRRSLPSCRKRFVMGRWLRRACGKQLSWSQGEERRLQWDYTGGGALEDNDQPLELPAHGRNHVSWRTVRVPGGTWDGDRFPWSQDDPTAYGHEGSSTIWGLPTLIWYHQTNINLNRPDLDSIFDSVGVIYLCLKQGEVRFWSNFFHLVLILLPYYHLFIAEYWLFLIFPFIV